MATTDYSLERGLPASIEAERSILGAILLDSLLFDQAAELKPDDFSLDAHRRIFARMRDLQDTGRPVDMITLAEELDRRKEVEAIGGVAYLSSLIDGVPDRPSIEHYVRIVRNKSLLRGLINIAQLAIAEAIDHSDEAEEVINRAEQGIFQLSENRLGQGFSDIPSIVKGSFGSLDELYARGQEITGLATHYTMLDKMTSGFQPSDLVIIAARPSMGKTALAMNIAENAAILDGKVVGVFSLEMSKEALLMRMLASHAQVDSHKLRTGFLGKRRHGEAHPRHGTPHAGAPLHRRHARHLGHRNALQGPPPQAAGTAASTSSSSTTCSSCRPCPSAASASRTAPRKCRPSRADSRPSPRS